MVPILGGVCVGCVVQYTTSLSPHLPMYQTILVPSLDWVAKIFLWQIFHDSYIHDTIQVGRWEEGSRVLMGARSPLRTSKEEQVWLSRRKRGRGRIIDARNIKKNV